MAVYKRNHAWYYDFYHANRRIKKKSRAPSRRLAELEMRRHMESLLKGDLGVDSRSVNLQQIIDRYVEHSRQFKWGFTPRTTGSATFRWTRNSGIS